MRALLSGFLVGALALAIACAGAQAGKSLSVTEAELRQPTSPHLYISGPRSDGGVGPGRSA